MNLYQPSVKRVKNDRVGSKLRRVYSPAQTPLERVLVSRQGGQPTSGGIEEAALDARPV
jgi:hypothetical protein